MIRQVAQAGSMLLILVAALYSPDVAVAHGIASGEDDPACAGSVSAWCISAPINPNTS